MTTKTRPKRVDLLKSDTVCPHCGGTLIEWYVKRDGRSGWRCRTCKCYWAFLGILIRWGSTCPFLTRAP